MVNIKFKQRNTIKESERNLIYYTKYDSNNPSIGINRCIIGNGSTDRCVLPNCMGYAYGRFLECQKITHWKQFMDFGITFSSQSIWNSLGSGKWSYDPTSDDIKWEDGTKPGITQSDLNNIKGQTPQLGALAMWDTHMAVVEEVRSDGSFRVSESGWGKSSGWYTVEWAHFKSNGICKKRQSGEGYDVTWPTYRTFYGFIYPLVPFNGVSPGSSEKQEIDINTAFNSKIISGYELARRAAVVATQYKTLYVIGAWGLALNTEGITKVNYTAHNGFNNQSSRREMIRNATNTTPLTWGFDCVCLLKALIWGWTGDESQIHGGATYSSNGQPDYGAEQIIDQSCIDISTDFSDIKVGELLGTTGHVGIYIGNGLGVECTPSWSNCVQITNVANIQRNSNYPNRIWKRHAKLSPLLTYADNTPIDLNNLGQLVSNAQNTGSGFEYIFGFGYFGQPIFDPTQTKSFIVERSQETTLIEEPKLNRGVIINSYGMGNNTTNVVCSAPTYTPPINIDNVSVVTNKVGLDIAKNYFKQNNLDLRVYGFKEEQNAIVDSSDSTDALIEQITDTSITLKYIVYKYQNQNYIKDILHENTSTRQVEWYLLVKYGNLSKEEDKRIPFESSDINTTLVSKGTTLGVESTNLSIIYYLCKTTITNGVKSSTNVYLPNVANGLLYKINGEPYTTQSLKLEKGETYSYIDLGLMNESEVQEIQTLIDNKVSIATQGRKYEKIDDMPKWFQPCFTTLSKAGIIGQLPIILNSSEMRVLLWVYNSLLRHGSLAMSKEQQKTNKFKYDI